MTTDDRSTIIQRAKENHPAARPRLITDNGFQFASKEFKQFVRISGMSHVRTRPYYPQSNGKIGRYHRTLNSDYTCQRTPLSQDDARQVVTEFVEDYNAERLHAALGYITPLDMLQGRQGQIHEERDRKIAEARNKRAAARAKLRESRQQAG